MPQDRLADQRLDERAASPFVPVRDVRRRLEVRPSQHLFIVRGTGPQGDAARGLPDIHLRRGREEEAGGPDRAALEEVGPDAEGRDVAYFRTREDTRRVV